MHRVAWVLLGVAACKPPPSCADVCGIVVDECGLGGDVDHCTAACKTVPTDDFARHDVRDCLSIADCGHLAAGRCADEPHCGGSTYYVVASADCLAAPRSVRLDEDCAVVPEPGDWGALGPPTLSADNVLVFDGVCTLDVDAMGNQGHCETDAGSCDYLVWPVI